MNSPPFRFGEWLLDPATNLLSAADLRRKMEARAMDLLIALCQKANTAISAEELLGKCLGSTLNTDI